MTTLAKKAETPSRRAIPSILIGCATMFVILELGVTFLAALLDQTWAALIVTAINRLRSASGRPSAVDSKANVAERLAALLRK